MDIVEFVAKFIEQEEALLRRVVFAFLGYATLAVAGLMLTYKEYCKCEDKERLKSVPKATRLLVGTFVFAGAACLGLSLKFDGRKNFCIEWLPAARVAYSDTVTDDELINNFLADYHRFDMGKGFTKHMEKYQEKKGYKEPITIRLGYSISQIEYLHWLLTFIFVFLSVDCYVTAIRRISLRDAESKWVLGEFLSWLKGLPR